MLGGLACLCQVMLCSISCRYDRAENVFRKIEDVQFVCAMGPPGEMAWRAQ